MSELAPLLLALAVEVTALPEDALARKYAPVVRLKAQQRPCGIGEPFQPMDVRLLLDNDTVLLRGPWDTTNVVKIAPEAGDLLGRFEYHLDFPGRALSPGCGYEHWSRRLTEGSLPTAYARVATEAGRPGKLALQYWFFYAFNDFNNKHEGDWEMIQLVFDARDAVEALTRDPVMASYSQHDGAERAKWGDRKLELVDGTHPVVYPAAGSHANHFEPKLFLGRSAAQGVGCDDTTGPWRELRPVVETIVGPPETFLRTHPWLGYEGRWGERQASFYNAPTGPNQKRSWTAPITWSEEVSRDHSFAVPQGASLGPSATDFFCDAMVRASDLLTRANRNPWPVLLVAGGLVALVLFAGARTEWESSAPLRLARRRAAGQIIAAARRMYAAHFWLFVGIGLLFVPVLLLAALLHWLGGSLIRLHVLGSNAFVVGSIVLLSLAPTVLALALVQAAVARAMVQIDAGRPVTALGAYRLVFRKTASVLGAMLLLVIVIPLLHLTIVGIPVAVFLVVRVALFVQVAELEGKSGLAALADSARLVRGRWWRVAAILALLVGSALLAGPLVGVVLLLLTGAPFHLVNLVSSFVYTMAMPFVTIATTYLYFDLVVRRELESEEHKPVDLLPAQI